MKNYLENLNQEQIEAVTTNEKYARVIAGAGSGKTRVLTSRVAYLIDKCGILDNHILCFTFTNKAAKEMKERTINILEKESLRTSLSTFHSFCAYFLRQEIPYINFTRNFTIIDEEDQKDIIKEIKKDIDTYKLLKVEEIISFISNCKNNPIILEDVDVNDKSLKGTTSQMKVKIFFEYVDYLKKNNYVDFDDLLLYTVEILTNFDDVRTKWANKYDYILVDEFQDVDNTQYQLLKLLTTPSTNLFVVGDPDQTIYTWRGANIDIIIDFKNNFKGTKDYILKTNYRSSKAILDCSNTLINHNKKRVKKDLVSFNNDGSKPKCYGASSQELEADWVALQIKNMVDNEKYKYDDFTILYRSNYYSGMIEHSLIKNRIPYAIFGNLKFYERKEIKDLMCYLRLIVNQDDILAFNRIINVPRRGIGTKTLDNILDESKNLKLSPYNYLLEHHIDYKNDKLSQFIDLIEEYKEKIQGINNPNFKTILDDLVNDSGYMESLDPIDDEDRIENLTELGNILFNSQINNPDATLETIIADLTLYSAQDSIVEGETVKLMTVHTAKGLEFKNVFIVGLSDGVFPNARSIRETRFDEPMEEERRLCYVAMTRAKENLFLTYNNGYSFSMMGSLSKSRFLTEVDNYIEYVTKPPYYKSYNQTYNTVSNTNIIDNSVKVASIGKSTDYRPGTIVIHKAFGEGVIIEVNDSSYKIGFKNNEYGTKTISKKFPGLSKKEG